MQKSVTINLFMVNPLTTYWWFFPNQIWKIAESLNILWSASNFRPVKKKFLKFFKIVHVIQAYVNLSQFDVKIDFLNLFLTVK